MQKVKIGDTVKILAVDSITREWQPELLNTEHVITGFNPDGDPVFAWKTVLPDECPFNPINTDTMCIDEQCDWRFEIVK